MEEFRIIVRLDGCDLVADRVFKAGEHEEMMTKARIFFDAFNAPVIIEKSIIEDYEVKKVIREEVMNDVSSYSH